MATHSILLCIILTISLFSHGIIAVEYQVTNVVANTPSGKQFTNKIGIPYTKDIMGKINDYVWTTIFQQNNPADRKPIHAVEVFIINNEVEKSIKWGKGNSKVNISASYLQKNHPEEMKREFTSLMYHEITHIFQWDAEGDCPEGLAEGVAEYTVLKANYSTSSFAKPGDGYDWDDGSGVTARFLEYCEGLTPGYVATLNSKMKKTYNVSYFKEITGKSVKELWNDYKAKYGEKH